MKLVYAIIHDEDVDALVSEMNKESFSVTKLCSTGGFLKSGNTTLLIGVEKEKVDEVISIIKKISKSRTKTISAPMTPGGIGGVFVPYNMDVVVGGATIFVVNVERFEKV